MYVISMLTLLYRAAARALCPLAASCKSGIGEENVEHLTGEGSPRNDVQTLHPRSSFPYVTHVFTALFGIRKGFSASAANQPRCGLPSEPACRLGSTELISRLNRAASPASLPKPHFSPSSRNFLPLHRQAKPFCSQITQPDRGLFLPAQTEPQNELLPAQPRPRGPRFSANSSRSSSAKGREACEGLARKGAGERGPRKAKRAPGTRTRLQRRSGSEERRTWD